MDYKEYLLNQTAINLKYIAEKMWPTNTNAQTYLSRKINGKGRPWTNLDNEKAQIAIHELGLQLIKDAAIKEEKPDKSNIESKEAKQHSNVSVEKKLSIWDQMDMLRNESNPGAIKQK